MKAITAISFLFLSHASFACITIGTNKICVKTIIYKDCEYPRGAEVLALNKKEKMATIKPVGGDANSLSRIQLKNISDSSGCFFGVCVGDIVLRGSDYGEKGARVEKRNLESSTLILTKIDNNECIAQVNPIDVDMSKENPEYNEAMRLKDKFPE